MEKLDFSSEPVLDDFSLFLTFLHTGKRIALTDKAKLKRADLFRINEELHYKADWVTEKSMQFYYPELDFFYYVVLVSKIAGIRYDDKSPYLEIKPDQIEDFKLLTVTEKYFFLLEAAWCYVNWGKLSENRGVYFVDSVEKLLHLVADSVPGQEFEVQNNRLKLPASKETAYIYLGGDSKIVQLFWLLGFYSLVPISKKPDRYTFGYEKIIAKPLGKQLAKVLLKERPLEIWNLPFRKEMGSGEIPLGLTKGEFYEEDNKALIPPAANEIVNPEFLKAFAPLVPEGELNESFFKNEKTFIGGRYTLQVFLTKEIYRTIALSASATLEDLHLAIQDAYKFDDDHLYAFYMDGERFSDESYNDPRGDLEPFASEVKIGELDLSPGQRFLYLFDFGDCWEFWVKVLEINPTLPEPKIPKVIDKKGRAPKQYRY